jgi:peptide/nickel transport system permease protein
MSADPAARELRSVASASSARTSRRRLVLRRFLRNGPADAAVVVMLLLIAFAVFGPHIGPWNATDLDFLNLQQPPSSEHWFGTDSGGGDLFALAAHGLGRSLLIGFIAAIGGVLIAAFVGTTIAYVGGKAEKVAVWVLDLAIVIPTFFLLALVVSSGAGGGGWVRLTLVLMLFYWFFPARVFRALALSLREREFITAARFMGLGSWAIVRRHLVPNLGSILIIYVALGVVGNVEAEAGLSFLGFGVTPPDTSLGLLIKAGTGSLTTAPWLFLIPAGLLVILCLSMQLIGDGLRDAFDPSSGSGGKA